MKRAISLISIAGILTSLTLPLHSQTLYWDSNGTTAGAGATPTGTWGTSLFWNTTADGTTTIPGGWVSGANAVFAAGSDASGAYTVTISGTQTAGSVLVEEGVVSIAGGAANVGAGTVTVNSGATLSTDSSARIAMTAGSKYILNGGTLRSSNPGAAGSFVDIDAVIQLNGGGTFSYTVAGVLNIIQGTTSVSGTGPLTKDGAGILAIAGACTYDGATIINNGTLRIRTSNNRLPIGTDLTINSLGIFDPAALSSEVRSVSGAGNTVYSGSGTLVVNQPSSVGEKTYTGIISDGTFFGKVEKKGTGSWVLGGLNTYDGTFTQTAGSTTVNAGAALAGPAADLVVNGGTLNLNNAAQTVMSLSGSGGTINLGSGHELTLNPGAGSKTYSGAINGAGALKKTGVGTLILAGTSAYAGGTTVGVGTLVVNGAINGAGAVTVSSGAFLQGNGTVGGSSLIQGTVAPGNNSIGTLTFSSSLDLQGLASMDLNPGAAQNADLISGSSIGLGGTLTVAQSGGTLVALQEFNLFDGTLTGGFAGMNLPDVAANQWHWDTSGLAAGGDGILRLVPEPSSLTLALLGGFGLFVRRMRRQ